jgi:hypothetical protein
MRRKWSEKDIEEIIYLRSLKYKLLYISHKFGVSANAVQKALSRKCNLYKKEDIILITNIFFENFLTKFPKYEDNLIEKVFLINKTRFKTGKPIYGFVPSFRPS